MSYKLTLQIENFPAREFPLTADEILIGRETNANIQIPDPAVSRRHARLLRIQDQYWIEDLGSSNGTYVNGQRLAGRQGLRNGDQIRLGQVLTLRYECPALSEEPTFMPDEDPFATRNIPAGQVEAAMQADRQADPAPGPALVQPQAASAPAAPTRLVIRIGSAPAWTAPLTLPSLTLGRAPGNDIQIDSRVVSRQQARLDRDPRGGYSLTTLAGAGNPFLLDGQPLAETYHLRSGDRLTIRAPDPALWVSLQYLEAGAVDTPRDDFPPLSFQSNEMQGAPANRGGDTVAAPLAEAGPSPHTTYALGPAAAAEARPPTTRRVDLGQKTLLRLGRDASNDILLNAPMVSRYHAELEKIGQRYRLRDLNSANGTFVNDRPVQGEVWLAPQDHVRIGPYRFVVAQDRLDQYDETGGLRVDAVGLNKWVRKDLNLLQDISLSIQPREFVVVVGQSGGGKTTLVDSLAGYRPATNGKVYVNGVDVEQNFDALRSQIGYVPQRDIIHMELTVTQALEYAARLRMPPDTSTQERRQRVGEVLNDLDLQHRADTQISKLSGGQQKRVSIGVELITQPGLFFLDEPTSGLDPGGETSLMQLMRKLADQGRTIVLITHATKNVMLADKVVFMARGGHLAWFGPPDEALRYFDQYRSERDRRSGPMEFDQIYAILEDAGRGSPQDWSQRYQQHPAYQRYILEPLARAGRLEGLMTASAIQRLGGPPSGQVIGRQAARLPQRRTTNAIQQFIILSSRNLRILTRDRFSLLLMLAVAPLTGLLSFILSSAIGRNPYDYANGYFPGVAISTFTLPVFGVLVGCLAQMREFVKEADIYKRERLVNLRILPYVLSKIWVALLLALYQAAAYVVIHYLAFDVPGGWEEFGLIYFTTVLAVLAGMMLGLLTSAMAPNANSAPLVMILFIIPQIVLAGVLVRLPGPVTAITSTRWAQEAILSITGAGSDAIRDPCWALSKSARLLLSNADKAAAGCNCSGLDALRPASCTFPGLGQFYDPAIDQPEPVGPAKPGDPPAEPTFPPPPPEPQNPADPLATAAYLQALKAFNAQVEALRGRYTLDLNQYQAQVSAYQQQAIAYEKDKAAWEIARSAAVSRAESLIEPMVRDHGWAFADKTTPLAYWGKIGRAWLAQGIIMLIAFTAILVLIKRKDGMA